MGPARERSGRVPPAPLDLVARVIALAADVEGEATTNYLVELLKPFPVSLTRIAHGLPAGGGLESADELTLYQALSGRTKL